MHGLKELFMLDPEVIFLNHGSFGATPRPVMEAYQEWLIKFEHQPVSFVDQEMPAYFETARGELGAYIKAPAEDVVYVPNVTFAVNLVARSLPLGPEAEVLTTDHEYGACDRAWQFLSQKRGFNYKRQHISMPATSAESIVEEFWQGVTPRTKIIFISHITSFTALRLPVELICERARKAGIITLVDGAHAPGQIDLDMRSVGADFYAGNGHKWLCGPKGSAFLYTRPECQHLVEPLVVSWGWGEESTFSFGSDYLDYVQWWGTQYPAAYLSLPAAIRFQEEHNWPAVRGHCTDLLYQAVNRVCDLTGLPSYYHPDSPFHQQMAIAPLPPIEDIRAFKQHLYQRYRVEIPCLTWRDRSHIRISIQGYNDQQDIDILLEALESLLPDIAR